MRHPVDRSHYPFIFGNVLMLAGPFAALWAWWTWGEGRSDGSSLLGVAAAEVSAQLGMFAGAESGYVAAYSVLAVIFRVPPYLELVPWRGSWHLYRNWRLLVLVGSLAAFVAFLTGRLDRSSWIVVGLMALGTAATGRAAYAAESRRVIRAEFYRYRNGIRAASPAAEAPVRPISAARLAFAGLLGGAVAGLSDWAGDKASVGPVFSWIAVAAVLLTLLEPLADQRTDDLAERWTPPSWHRER